MRQFRIHTEADSRSNRRSRNWTIEADNADDAIYEAQIRHSLVIKGGDRSIWTTSAAELIDDRAVELAYVKGEWAPRSETCAGCGQPITTPNTLPEALRTAGARQCQACDLLDRL